jgi:flavin reductase (DIM6/NTAB) family NADH-FMN oxidoreductase RutF
MKKPWNIANLPVHSLATYNSNQEVNMNICTYVSAISMQPKMYAIAVYENTKTLENIYDNDNVVLQLLHINQYNLVKKLGQTSGLKTNKYNYLHKKNVLELWNEKQVLKDVSARVLLEKISYQKTGDHYLFIFNAIASKSYCSDYLDINTLREKSIVRM